MIGRGVVAIGLVLVVVGLLWPWLGKLGLGRLPGDIVIDRGIFGSISPSWHAIGDQTDSATSFLIKVVAADKRCRGFRVVLRHQSDGLLLSQLKRAYPHIVTTFTLLQRSSHLSFKSNFCLVETAVHPHGETHPHADALGKHSCNGKAH